MEKKDLYRPGELFKLYNSYRNDDFLYGVIIKYDSSLWCGDYYQCLVNNKITTFNVKDFKKL